LSTIETYERYAAEFEALATQDEVTEEMIAIRDAIKTSEGDGYDAAMLHLRAIVNAYRLGAGGAPLAAARAMIRLINAKGLEALFLRIAAVDVAEKLKKPLERPEDRK
jgi:hypothetical protein